MTKKSESRSNRWAAAVGEARVALENFGAAIEALKEIQSEYEEWQSNLPENLANSALGDKLNYVVDLDLDCLSEAETAIDEAEGIDLPLGFGRD